MKIILIYGLPAVGKTTIVKYFAHGQQRIEKPFVHYVNGKYCIFGDYDSDTPFLGTDKLSMSIQPTAVEFIKNNQQHFYIIEGDRLFNSKFIEALNPIVLIIEAPIKSILQRRIDRGVAQDETFLKAKHTKIENIKQKYSHYVLQNNSQQDIDNIRNEIMNLLNGNSKLEMIPATSPSLF